MPLTLRDFTAARGRELILTTDADTGEVTGIADRATLRGRQVNALPPSYQDILAKQTFRQVLQDRWGYDATSAAMFVTFSRDWLSAPVPLSDRDVKALTTTAKRFHENPALARNSVDMEQFIRTRRASPQDSGWRTPSWRIEDVFAQARTMDGGHHLRDSNADDPEFLARFRAAVQNHPDFARAPLLSDSEDPRAFMELGLVVASQLITARIGRSTLAALDAFLQPWIDGERDGVDWTESVGGSAPERTPFEHIFTYQQTQLGSASHLFDSDVGNIELHGNIRHAIMTNPQFGQVAFTFADFASVAAECIERFNADKAKRQASDPAPAA